MATPSAQIIVLPDIPELYDDNFLDILLPVRGGGPTAGRATTTPGAVNPVIEALIENSRRTFTNKGAPAYNSTGSAILAAFHNLSTYTLDVTEYPSKSWIEDPELTLHLIWSLRSLPDEKVLKDRCARRLTCLSWIHLCANLLATQQRSSGKKLSTFLPWHWAFPINSSTIESVICFQ